jgi:hypothetical protein
MGARLKSMVMVVVLFAWAAYVTFSLINHQVVPIPRWTVPGATYAVLGNKTIKFGKVTISDKETKEDD